MQFYIYVVNMIGDGTDGNPFRPDIPEGYSWIGKQFNETKYGIATKVLLPSDEKYRRIHLTSAEIDILISEQEDITKEDIENWYVGG